MFERVPLSELIIIGVVLKLIAFGVSFSDAIALLVILLALNYPKLMPDKKQHDLDEIQKRIDAIERDTTVLKMRQLK